MFQPPRLRVALGLGDQELEQRLRPALDAVDGLAVVAQCLAAEQLLHVVEARLADAVVIAASLHRLTDEVLAQIDRSGLAVVLLVPDPDEERWGLRPGTVVGLDADAATIQAVLVASVRGDRILHRPRPRSEPLRLKAVDRADSAQIALVVAITGGYGSPGRTTVAMNLAAALGTAAPTVLVEVDLCAPALAAYLDRDPTRSVCTLAYAVREDPRAWASALADELQPLTANIPGASVLCGPPKREMRISIAPSFVERLVAELARRYRYVILDVGPDLLGMDSAAANHRAALATAQRLLVVSGCNLVGLWHARTALDQLERQLGVRRQSVQLVLNRHEPRQHHARPEVEWHLGSPVAAVIPADYAATERAIAEQRPLVTEAGSRAARALLELAERVHEGRLRLPPQVAPTNTRRARWWRRLWPRGEPAVRGRPALALQPEPLRATQTRSRRSQVW